MKKKEKWLRLKVYKNLEIGLLIKVYIFALIAEFGVLPEIAKAVDDMSWT